MESAFPKRNTNVKMKQTITTVDVLMVTHVKPLMMNAVLDAFLNVQMTLQSLNVSLDLAIYLPLKDATHLMLSALTTTAEDVIDIILTLMELKSAKIVLLKTVELLQETNKSNVEIKPLISILEIVSKPIMENVNGKDKNVLLKNVTLSLANSIVLMDSK